MSANIATASPDHWFVRVFCVDKRVVTELPFMPAGFSKIAGRGGKSLNNPEVGRFEFHGGGENADVACG